MVLVRMAKPDDLEQIKKIVRDSFHEDYAAAGEFYSVQQMADPNYATQTGPYYDMEAFVKDIIDGMEEKLSEPFECFVACNGGDVVGFIVTENNNSRHWVNNIFVGKGHQAEGIGKELFDFASRGKRELYLWVNSKNPAVDFWENLGFKTVLQERLMRRI